jgi:hypothetical protein
MIRGPTIVTLLLALPTAEAFIGVQPHRYIYGTIQRCPQASALLAEADWQHWASLHGVEAPKLTITSPSDEERGKGGVHAAEDIAAMAVIATIPRALVLAPCEQSEAVAARAGEACSWATELTAAALMALHTEATEAESAPKREWVRSWLHGGWATDPSDLGAEDVRWGPRDVTGNLLATGSDNDANIYAKFRFPCHPVLHRAGLGLAQITGCDKQAALEALQLRGRHYRSMRDALSPLVAEPTERRTGSARERRCWDVAEMLSRVISRATAVQLDGRRSALTPAVVPLHERLEHCCERGENAKLVGADPRATIKGSNVLLVATRDIQKGEPITRDYTLAPRLPEDTSDGALRLLLQFGLPPKAWPQ